MKHAKEETREEWLRRMADERIMDALETAFAIGVNTDVGQRHIGITRGIVFMAFMADAIDAETFRGFTKAIRKY